MIDMARKVAALPALVLWLVGAIVMFIGAVGDRLNDMANRAFRRACARRGHRMGDWWLGWRHCARCDWAEPMPDELRPDILGRRPIDSSPTPGGEHG